MREEELEKLYDEYIAARRAFEEFRDTHEFGAATEELDTEAPTGSSFELLPQFNELKALMDAAKRRYDEARLKDP